MTFSGFVAFGTPSFLHKFMVAISRIEVNHDGFGGTAPDGTKVVLSKLVPLPFV